MLQALVIYKTRMNAFFTIRYEWGITIFKLFLAYLLLAITGEIAQHNCQLSFEGNAMCYNNSLQLLLRNQLVMSIYVGLSLFAADTA